jgi:hypothetical protein
MVSLYLGSVACGLVLDPYIDIQLIESSRALNFQRTSFHSVIIDELIGVPITIP